MADQRRNRAACEECRSRKLRCTGEYPTCSRCVVEGIACSYSTQKPMGRPKKRKVRSDDTYTYGQQSVPLLEGQTSQIIEETLTADTSLLDTLAMPGFGLHDFTAIEETDLLQASASSSALDQPCACLSAMYLILEKLRSMDDFTFPGSFGPLREALHTASGVIRCEYCPARFLTATQNVHLLGTLLLSIAERYGRILTAIEAEGRQAAESYQMKTIRLGSVMVSGQCLDAADWPVVELEPSAWSSLARKAVKAEVHGTSDESRASLSSIVRMFEQRQEHWHESKPTSDCPDPERRRLSTNNKVENPMCLMLAKEAKRLVGHFNFE